MSSENSNRTADLPPGWERVPLREIAEINPGLEIRIENEEQHVNFVPMRAVEPEGAGLLRPEVRAYGEVKKGYTVFRSGDVIMAKITPCMENGKTTVVPELPDSICFGSTEFHVIRPEIGIDPRWISNFLLQHEIRRAAQRSMAGGVGQMRVPGSFVAELNIPVPPRAEAQRIFAKLDELLPDLGAAVASLENVRKQLPLYRAAVLKAAAEGSLTAEWRQQHPTVEPASELLDRILKERRRRWEERQLRKFDETTKEPPKNWKAKYKEPVAPDTRDLPTLPPRWVWVSLDQIADIAGGVTKGQKFFAADKTRAVPYLRVANVQRGYLDLSEIKNIRALETDIEALRLQKGDVLFNEGGDRDKLGRGWVWEGEIPECIHQNHVFRVRLLLPDVQPKYVSWCGNSYGQRWFSKTGKQSVNLASINLTVLRSFPVPLAPAVEQEAIVEATEDQLSVVTHVEKDLSTKLKHCEGLAQSILRRALDGHLVAQDSSDEPTSELLKRIAAEREERARVAKAVKNSPLKTVRSHEMPRVGA